MKNLLIVLLLLPTAIMAQKTHTVVAKETLFSIGRLYEVHPKDLASYNKISFDDGVKIGQVLKIPEKKTIKPIEEKSASAVNSNPTKTNEAKPVINTNTKPQYHIVLKGESLYHISRKYEGATVVNLKKWNNLSENGLREGQKLIVAYQTSDNTEVNSIINSTDQTTKDQLSNQSKTPVASDNKVSESNISVDHSVKEPSKVIASPNAPELAPASISTPVKEAIQKGDGGYFKSLFIVQTRAVGSIKTENGKAAVFKSNSGWDDGKYYCLFSEAPSGTILKIKNQTSQKFIYAKVLDVIPDVQQNEDILVRLSNSAAAELGAEGEKFQVEINYQKN